MAIQSDLQIGSHMYGGGGTKMGAVTARMHIVQIPSIVTKWQNNEFTMVIHVICVAATAAAAAVVAVLFEASLDCHIG